MTSIFSRIAAGEIPGRILWSDEICFALLDIRPLHPGHALVIPRAEIDHWLDLDAATVAHLTEVARVVGLAQQSVVECERIGLMIAGFEVPHTHVHVVPLASMANLDFANADSQPVASELDAMAESLRQALRDAGHGASVPN